MSLQLKLKTVPLFHSLIFWWKKTNNSFSTSLFRKKTFTGLYTNFSFLSPNGYKTNLISCLVYRAFHICSSYANFHNEILRIKCILAKNCFPQSLADKFIRSFLDKQFSKVSTSNNQEGKKTSITFCLPYLGTYSIRIKKNVIKLLKENFPDVKLQVVFRSPVRLSSLFKFKDRCSTLMCYSVIYKYTCSSCNATYYGKTTRNLKVRCLEDLGINRRGHKTNSSCQSSIADSINKTAHNATMEDFKIIAKSDTAFDLLIYESLSFKRIDLTLTPNSLPFL